MTSPFRKISRVGSLMGGTKWYLSDDCLLAAKRILYAVEYKRFYLSDLESIVVWRDPLWLLRLILPSALLLASGAAFWYWVNVTTGQVIMWLGIVWASVEVIQGPTAKARIQTSGVTVNLPLVRRTRRTRGVLDQIDAAVRAARGSAAEQTASQAVFVAAAETAMTAQPSTGPATGPATLAIYAGAETGSGSSSATVPVVDPT